MSMWWSLQLRRETASVPLARRLLLDALGAEGVDPEVAHDLSVALTEACANAVEHGAGEGSRAYRVTAYLDGDLCRIEVADTGPGFGGGAARVPRAGIERAVDAEHGRGLFLIESLADHVRFADRSDRGGAVVSFDKVLRRSEDPRKALLQAS